MSRPEASTGEAARVGEELRDARLSLGVSLEEAADKLRINRRYLAALEEGRVRDLPGVAYATGFIRTYAIAMGLDADDLVRRFREAAGGARPKENLVFPEPVPERGVPGGALVLVGAVLAIGAYAAWYNWSGTSNRTVDAVPPLPQRLESAAEQSRSAARDAANGQAPAATNNAAPGATPAPGAVTNQPAPAGSASPAPATPPTGSAQAPGNRAPGTATPAPAGSSAAPGTPPAGTAQAPGNRTPGTAAPAPAGSSAASGTPASPPAAPAPPAAPSAPAAATPGQTRVTLRATGDSWVQVRDSRSGEVVFNRVMRAGESYDVPNRPGLLLTTGKAQELSLVVDGQASNILDGTQAVRRDIPLDPARLRPSSGTPAAPASPAAPR
ncbi:helix-turn-helix domain-containing protein [Acetobacteraceae bacterium H6797]|nr:helix-turn-helix domain-containing protein [Acetobacteraceae bacterium H6797]